MVIMIINLKKLVLVQQTYTLTYTDTLTNTATNF